MSIFPLLTNGIPNSLFSVYASPPDFGVMPLVISIDKLFKGNTGYFPK